MNTVPAMASTNLCRTFIGWLRKKARKPYPDPPNSPKTDRKYSGKTQSRRRKSRTEELRARYHLHLTQPNEQETASSARMRPYQPTGMIG